MMILEMKIYNYHILHFICQIYYPPPPSPPRPVSELAVHYTISPNIYKIIDKSQKYINKYNFLQLYAPLRYFAPLCATLRHFTPLCATLLYLGRPPVVYQKYSRFRLVRGHFGPDIKTLFCKSFRKTAPRVRLNLQIQEKIIKNNA